jgi:hypothetical protein
MIPHDGQGEPLPPDFPFEGEWLGRNHVFLYRPEGTELVGGTAPRFTRGWIADDGYWRLGFDAGQLAAGFGVSVEDLFDANRRGIFMIAGTADVDPSHGRERAKEYVFSLGGLTQTVIIEYDPRAVSGYSSQ